MDDCLFTVDATAGHRVLVNDVEAVYIPSTGVLFAQGKFRQIVRRHIQRCPKLAQVQGETWAGIYDPYNDDEEYRKDLDPRV